jgi:threonine/homoserine/homoserine lactone efflux protein
LGVRLLLDQSVVTKANGVFPAQHLGIVYQQAVLTNVLNPKVALFFMSFLPQFVDPASHTKVLAFLFLGAVFIFNSTIYCSVIAWFASAISSRLRESSTASSVVKRATGALFVGLGLKLAVTK